MKRTTFILALCLGLPAVAAAQDSDGDGVSDAADAFPCDHSRAAVSYFPGAATSALLAFEDQWPGSTDLDFNDVVVRAHYRLERNAAGDVVQLHGAFDPVAAGGVLNNGLALQLPASRIGATARRRVAGGAWQALAFEADATATVVLSQNLRELFGNAANQVNSIPGAPRIEGQRIELEITFATPAPMSVAAAPFDVFIFRTGNLGHQVHFPHYPGTAAMNTGLFNTDHDASTPTRRFVHLSGVPAALNLMTTSRYPVEGTAISLLFPDIIGFAMSAGTQNTSFYANNVVALHGHEVSALAPPVLAPPDESCLISTPSALAWAGPAVATTVDCTPLTLQIRADDGSPASFAEARSFALSGTPGAFYGNSSCTSAISSASFGAGVDSATVYHRHGSTGNLTLVAQGNGLTQASHALRIDPAHPTNLQLTGPATMTTVSCAPYSIRAHDALGFPANAIGNITLQLGPGAHGGAFFTSSACDVGLSSTQISSGTNSITVYFRQQSPGSTTLTASASGLTGASIGVTVSEAPANNLTFDGPVTFMTVECPSFSVTTRDAAQTIRPVTATTVLALSDGGANGQFFADESCAFPVSTATLQAGASQVTFYYRKTAAGPANLQADAVGFSPAQLNVGVTEGPGADLSFSADELPIVTTADCIRYVITVQDAHGNVANASSNLVITLSGAGSGGAFYSANTCSGTVSSRTIPMGLSTTEVWYRKTTPGTVTLNAFRDGLSPATRVLTVVTPQPTQLVFNVFANPISSNACGSYRVQLRDQNNNAANTAVPVTVDLSDDGGGAFFSNSTCTLEVTSIVVAAGTSFTNFYYRRPGPASLTITANSVVGNRANALNVSSGIADRLAWTSGATSILTNTCSLYQIRRRDERNLDAPAPTAMQVNLTGLGDGDIFSNSTCTTPITSVQIPASSAIGTFYYRKPTTGTVVLSASTPEFAGSWTRTVNVSGGVPTRLVFSSATGSPRVGVCASYAVQLRDDANLAVTAGYVVPVSLSDNPAGGSFFSNNTCTNEITEAQIGATASSVTFYYRRYSTGSVVLTTTSPGLTSASYTTNVINGLPAAVTITPGAPTAAVGGCTPYTLTLRDIVGTPVSATANVTVNVSTTLAGATIYEDESCTLEGTSLLIPTPATARSFYLLPSAAGSGTLNATSSGLTSDSIGVTAN